MASPPTPTSTVKTLREILQEQEEPFLLQVYLLDNGYLENRSCNCWPGYRSISSKSSTKLTRKAGSKNREVFFANWSKLLKTMLKTVSRRGCTETCTSNDVKTIENRKAGHAAYSDMKRERPPDPSNVVGGSFLGFLHCNASSIDGYSLMDEQTPINTKGKQRRSMEEWKQFSPVSVLEVASELDVSPIQKHEFPKERTFLEKHYNWSFVLLSVKENMGLEDQEQQELYWVDSSSHIASTRRLLSQSEDLLLDCVMEAAHNLELKNTTNHTAPQTYNFMQTKNLCDEIYEWSRQGGDGSNISQLLQRDLSSNAQEWGHNEPHILEEIAGEIADAIFKRLCQGLISDIVHRSPTKY